jgi:dTDP-4-dehydrorhamnose 3,5-epimerase
MKISSLRIPDVLLIEPSFIEDSRGVFFESFNQKTLEKNTLSKISFVQESQSESFKGVLRGLHYQMPPFAQAKLIRVIKGKVMDVVVDLRRSSPYFSKFIITILSGTNKKQLYIPEGFAHGFLTLSTSAEFLYKTTNHYNQDYERCIIWNDLFLNIPWPKNIDIKLSTRDQHGLKFLSSDIFE